MISHLCVRVVCFGWFLEWFSYPFLRLERANFFDTKNTLQQNNPTEHSCLADLLEVDVDVISALKYRPDRPHIYF